MIIVANIKWIGPDYGGRSRLPVIGLRPIIRFQRYIDEWVSSAWDVEIIDLEIDENAWSGITKLRLSKNAPANLNGLKEGELIELLDSYRVIGIGKIVDVETIETN